MVKYRFYSYEKDKILKQYKLDSNNFSIEFNTDSLEVLFKNNDIQTGAVKIDRLIEELKKLKTEPVLKDLTIEDEKDKLKYRIIFQYISGERENDKDKITSFTADVFLKLK
jgi:hypothetical protein